MSLLRGRLPDEMLSPGQSIVSVGRIYHNLINGLGTFRLPYEHPKPFPNVEKGSMRPATVFLVFGTLLGDHVAGVRGVVN